MLNATIRSTLNVSGTTTLLSASTIGSTLNVVCNTTINGLTTIIKAGETFQLGGTAISGSGSYCIMGFYPNTVNQSRKGYLGYPNNDSVNLEMFNQNTSGSIVFGTNSSPRVLIDSSGDVGINTLSPGTVSGGTVLSSAKFHVANSTAATGVSTIILEGPNNSLFRDWPSGWYGGISTMDISCSGVYYTYLIARSDVRKKTNIQNCPYGLNEVLQLRPVTFKWIDRLETNPNEIEYGFIAQEVEQIIPDLVNEDSLGFKNIKNAYAPLLVKAVKELNNELEIAKNKIATLEEKVKEIDTIKSYLNI
jgi:hypothetical protein